MTRQKTTPKFMATAALVCVALTAPIAAKADSLAAAMTDAYNNSGLLEQNRALLRAADENVAGAMAALRPIVSWSADVTRSFSRGASAASRGATVRSSSTAANVGLSAQWLLWDGGSSKLGVEVAKESVLATRQGLIAIEQQVLFQALQAYINIRTNSETVALRQSNTRVISEELRAAKDRFEVGEVTRTDVAQAEARLAEARAALAQAQGDLSASRENFIAVVGRAPGSLKAPPRAPQTAKSVADAKAIAVRNHPDIKRGQHAVSAADLRVQSAQLATTPNLTLRGTLGASDTFNSSNYGQSGSVSLNLSGPIYQGGQIASSRRAAIASRDAERAALRVTSLGVAENAGSSFANLQVARAAREAGDRAVRFARVAFRGVREEATLGARTTLDVLNAEQELRNAEANLITATGNEILASYVLLANMGLLTADHLKLKVTKYDPEAYYNLVKSAPTPKSKQGRDLDRVLKSLGKE